MHRLFSIFAGLVLAFFGPSMDSYGAEQNTYRAGQPYMKTQAQTHVQCEQYCRGDAGCKGWNFIRTNPRNQFGICELNGRKVLAQSSPVSISGEMNSYAVNRPNHTIPKQGRTVRVGTPIVPRRVSRNVPRTEIRGGALKHNSVAAHPQINMQMPQNTPTAKKQIPEQIQEPMLAQTSRWAQNRERQIYRKQMLAAQRHAQEQSYSKNFGAKHVGTRSVGVRSVGAGLSRQTFVPLSQRGFIPQLNFPTQASVQTHVQAHTNVPQNLAPATLPNLMTAPPPIKAPPVAATKPVSRPVFQQPSLYGSLHDDLVDLTQNMTSVPRPQTAPDRVDNPDAPLSTSRAIPTKPVKVIALERPEISQLAGGL